MGYYPAQVVVGFQVMAVFVAVYLSLYGVIVYRGRHSFTALLDCVTQTTLTACIVMAAAIVTACNGVCCSDASGCQALKHDYVCATSFEKDSCSNYSPPLSTWLFPIFVLYGLNLAAYLWSAIFHLELGVVKRRPVVSFQPYVVLAVVLNLKHAPYNVLCAFYPASADYYAPSTLTQSLVQTSSASPAKPSLAFDAADSTDYQGPAPSAPLRPLSLTVDNKTPPSASAFVPLAHATVVSPAQVVLEAAAATAAAHVTPNNSKAACQYQCPSCLWHITYVPLPEGSAVIVCPKCLNTWTAPSSS